MDYSLPVHFRGAFPLSRPITQLHGYSKKENWCLTYRSLALVGLLRLRHLLSPSDGALLCLLIHIRLFQYAGTSGGITGILALKHTV